jgi:glycosyltransferase involved in cell wall biosynthesis
MITPYYYPVIGGITSFVGNLRNVLSERIASVSIITGNGDPGENVEVIGPNRISSVLRVFRLIRKIKPDIIHTHAHWSFLIPSAFYKVFHPGTVLVHTFHTDPRKHIKGMKKIVFSILLSRYDHVTFVSKALMDTYVKDYRINFKSTSVIYAGVSITIPDAEKQEDFINSHNLDGRYPILCFVGPLTWKMKVEGVKRLIVALEIVKRSYPSSALIIVGDGDYRKELEALVSKNDMKDQVIFTGFLKEPEIPLSISDIYTHISLQEGQPIALLEAMAQGKPVIASRTGGIPEIIQDNKNGILTETEPRAIADNIMELLRNEKRMESLGKIAQKLVKEEFDWEVTTSEFMALYEAE